MLGETNKNHKPWFKHQCKELMSTNQKLYKQGQRGVVEHTLILIKLSNEYHQLLNFKKKKYQ